MAYTTQYIGSRYVPTFADPAEWNSARTYEPLTIVLNGGNSYTSRQFVPVGVQITNTDYWLETGNYNAQVEAYRQEVLQTALTTLPIFSTVADMQTSKYLNAGDYCVTLGFNTPNDNGGSIYFISAYSSANGMDTIRLANNLQATLIPCYYVTPEMFNAIGDGTNDDTNAFTRMFNYISEKSVYSPGALQSLVCVLSQKKYNITTITVPTQRNLIINGNNASILNGTLNFNSFAYSIEINNISFTNTSFNFTGEVEFTNITFYKCMFNKCNNPLHFERRSSMTKIDTCQFHSFTETQIYMYNADSFVIDNCWFEPSATEFSDGKVHAVITQRGNAESGLKIFNSLLISQWHPASYDYETSTTICCFVDANGCVEIAHCRKSNENPGNMALVHTDSSMTDFTASSGHRSFVNIHDCNDVEEIAIILYGIPYAIYYENNASIKDVVNKIIVWDANIDDDTKQANLSRMQDIFRLVLADNSNTYFDRHYNHVNIPSSIMPCIPYDLVPFIDRGWKRQHGEIGIAYFRETQNGYGLYTSCEFGIYGINNYLANCAFLITCHSWYIGSSAATQHIYLFYLEGMDTPTYTPRLIDLAHPDDSYSEAPFTLTVNETEVDTQLTDQEIPTFDNPLDIVIKYKIGIDVTNLNVIPMPHGLGIGQL